MMSNSKGAWNLGKDLCRCCHSEGSFKNLYKSYFWLDIQEVYSKMLRELLDIELAEVGECLRVGAICDVCIQRLRDAAQFKSQVLECEILFRRNENISVPAAGRLKDNKMTLSKIKRKRKSGHPRKHTILLKSYETDIFNSKIEEDIVFSMRNKSKVDVGNNNKDMEDIGINNKDMEDIGINNKDMEDIGNNDKNMEDIGNNDKNMEDIGISNKDTEDIGNNSKNVVDIGINEKVLMNNNKCDDGDEESNFEYDSDTPISRFYKQYANRKDMFIVDNKSCLDSVDESPNVICKVPQYKVYRSPKPVSERKRIRLTCETVLRETTGCPFRHHKSWFRCFYCTQDFMDIDKLRQHTLQNHKGDDITTIKRYPRTLQIDITDFRCKMCSEDLTDVQHMVEHFSKVHQKVVYKECIADYKVTTSPYTCHLCWKQYHVFRTLTTHLNEHYANCICDVCGKPFLNTKRLKVHKRTHESGDFPCSECGKVLKTKTSKANHMESHSKRILKCHICSKPMKHYNDRVKHMSEEHNITHKFKCHICGREYNIKHYLATHMRQTHGHKNKKCLECGMAFITNHGLKKHMLKHTGEKGFPCTMCDKAYARSYTLKEHMRGHRREK